MAAACRKLFNRASVSSLKSTLRSTTGSTPAASSAGFRLPPSQPSRHFSFSRCPSELGCLQSLLPLHSSVAAARLTSCLSTTSRNSRALSQGT
ncbi:hypothetical protein AtEden1_Chr4g0293371 [Arabidopsis thaliana]